MVIKNEFVKIVVNIEEKIDLDLISDAFFPKFLPTDMRRKFSNFGAIKLEDGSIGIVFIGLSQKIRKKVSNININTLIGINPVDLAKKFDSARELERTLALGAINAISQSIFKKVNYEFDFVSDSLGLLNLNDDDKVGMVGYFPPLVKKIEKMNIPLVVIEKKEFNIKTKENWEITLDPSKLKSCNKILCTSTTVLNDSLDEILSYTKNAEKISMVGPTGGFLPDPIFQRGVDVLGGTFIADSDLFIHLIRQNKKWGPATRKYCIHAKNYKSYKNLIRSTINS
ncbi:MAG: Rossmann-like domain-containing protein [Promethearchaeati archaeon]